MTPGVSVVIPSYGHERYVGQAVRSVLEQSVDDLELVVVDDGSPDRSNEVIREVLAGFPDRRATLIEQPNAGAHSAIMRGIDASRAEIVTILNSDDYYLPGRLEHLLPHVRGRQYGLAFSEVMLVDGTGAALPEDHAWPAWYRSALDARHRNPTVGFALLEQNFSVTSGNFVFTRGTYDTLGGFSAHRFLHDWDFLIRATYLCEPEFVPAAWMCYRIHGQNTTESVRSLLDSESRDAIARFRSLCDSGPSPNALCPHPDNWPAFFPHFLDARRTFFDGQPMRAYFG